MHSRLAESLKLLQLGQRAILVDLSDVSDVIVIADGDGNLFLVLLLQLYQAHELQVFTIFFPTFNQIYFQIMFEVFVSIENIVS